MKRGIVIKKKLAIFFDLAKKMNRKFSVIPMLYGSLGLQMLVDDDLNPDDIDICVPQFMYRFSERWQDLLVFMQSEGYELINLHERLFKKDDIVVNIGVIDGEELGSIPSLEFHANIDITEFPIKETDGAIYKLLTLQQYLAVYMSSQNDEYRKEKTNDKDQIKIDAIHKALTRNK